MAFKSLGIAAIFIVLGGCNEITEVYLKARKDLFYSGSVVSFQDLQNNEEVNLMISDYGCHYEPGSDIQTSTHAYNRYYPQLCGQSARRTNSGTHPLDHSISVYGTYYIHSGIDIGWIYFQHDCFVVDPLPSIEDAVIVSLGLDGKLYEGVYRLTPREIKDGHEIEAIFFHPDYGTLRVVSVSGQMWNRRL